MKITIFFVSFFASFLFLTPLAQASDSECFVYTASGNYYDTAGECSDAGWALCLDEEVIPGVFQYQGYYEDYSGYNGTACTNANGQAGACDGAGSCNPTCTPSWSCGDWVPSDGNCGDTLNQTRTCTDSNSCGTTDGKPSESQTSTGTFCTSPVYGSWGACSDSYADVCDISYSGTQSRTATNYACSSNVCSVSGSLPNETQNCSGSRTVSNTTVYGTVSCPSGSSGSCTQYCNGAGGYTACTPSCTETACLDGVDNDGDGNTDGADSDCVPADNTAPTVTVNQATGQADPTNASPVNFTAVFSETPFGLDGSEVQITGTAGGTKTVAITGSGTARNLAVSGMTNGTVIAAIPAGVFIDAAGNPNIASTSTDNIVAYDTAGPGTPGTPAPTTPPSNTTPTWTWTASAGDPAWYLVYWSATAGGTDNSATVFTNSFTHTTALAAGTWYMKVKAFDLAGNPSGFSGNRSVVIDPTLTFPSNTWQRLWYTNPSVLNFEDFSPANYLGENAILNIDNDWGGGQLYATNAPNTDSGKNNIGFRASRTYNLTGPYTITIGADDGIKLFTNGESDPLKNLLPGGAWQNNHSYNDNIHKVRLEPSGGTKFEIRYRENTGNARISFSYAPGFTDVTQDFECRYGTTCLNDPQGWLGCGPRVMGDGYCYYNSSTTCGTDPVPTGCYAGGWCTYQSRCIVLPGQTCTTMGCVEGVLPDVTINTLSDQWYPAPNPIFNLTATDNVALQSIKYQIDDYTADQVGTAATSDGSSPLAVSGISMTADWKIKSSDDDAVADSWDDLSQGPHTIYVKAIDTSANCRGCTNATIKSFTIKKDTLLPNLTPNIAGAASGSQRTPGPDNVLNTADDVFLPWFKEGTYYLDVADRENQSAGNGKYSGLDTARCKYGIYDVGMDEWTVPLSTPRTCSTQTGTQQIGIEVGATKHCGKISGTGVGQSEGIQKCLVYIELYDIAGNINDLSNRWFYLNIDRTKPWAE